MKLTIDTRAKGFRAIWQDGRGHQGRELLPSEVELKMWLERFDFATCKPISSDESAARSFAAPTSLETIAAEAEAVLAQIEQEHDEESRGSDG